MGKHLMVSWLFHAVKPNLLLWCVLLYGVSFSQEKLETLSQNTSTTNAYIQEEQLFKNAKQLIDSGDYQSAVSLLEKNNVKYSNTLNINWVYAYALWYSKQYKKAKFTFEKTIRLAPNNKELEAAYMQFLYQTGELIELEPLLEKKQKNKTASLEEKGMLANLYFWRGKIKAAKSLVAELKMEQPNSKTTQKLEQNINALTASYIHFKNEYQNDSQPLEYFANHIEIGEYFSRYFSPKLSLSNFRFQPQQEQAFSLKVTNDFLVDRLDLKVSAALGVYNNISDGSDWIGGIHLNKSIIKNVALLLGYDKSPLLTTIASTSINLTEQKLYGIVDYKNKYFQLNTGFHHAYYADDNYINSISAWMLSKSFSVYNFNFQMGYGFNYMDAKDILFIYDSTGNGVYDPYFTPKEQMVHSLLAVLQYKISDDLAIDAKMNYGLEATVQNPYPITVAPNVVEIGGFYSAPFDYREFIATVNYSLSKRFQIQASYLYQETFFYDRNNYSLGLNYRF